MALRARNRCMSARQRKDRRVIEGRRSPVCSRVAMRAVGRESCGNVSGILGSRKVSLMAPIAGGGQRCVVVIHVALRTLNGRMRAGERETRLVVIERSQRPRSCVVALRAVGRKS